MLQWWRSWFIVGWGKRRLWSGLMDWTLKRVLSLREEKRREKGVWERESSDHQLKGLVIYWWWAFFWRSFIFFFFQFLLHQILLSNKKLVSYVKFNDHAQLLGKWWHYQSIKTHQMFFRIVKFISQSIWDIGTTTNTNFIDQKYKITKDWNVSLF